MDILIDKKWVKFELTYEKEARLLKEKEELLSGENTNYINKSKTNIEKFLKVGKLAVKSFNLSFVFNAINKSSVFEKLYFNDTIHEHFNKSKNNITEIRTKFLDQNITKNNVNKL